MWKYDATVKWERCSHTHSHTHTRALARNRIVVAKRCNRWAHMRVLSVIIFTYVVNSTLFMRRLWVCALAAGHILYDMHCHTKSSSPSLNVCDTARCWTEATTTEQKTNLFWGVFPCPRRGNLIIDNISHRRSALAFNPHNCHFSSSTSSSSCSCFYFSNGNLFGIDLFVCGATDVVSVRVSRVSRPGLKRSHRPVYPVSQCEREPWVNAFCAAVRAATTS